MKGANPEVSIVVPQAVRYFHQQVGSVVAHISEQCKELFGEEQILSKTCSREQMKAQLKQALIASGRYFTFKEQMEVRGPTSISRTLKLICNHFLMLATNVSRPSVLTACSREGHP